MIVGNNVAFVPLGTPFINERHCDQLIATLERRLGEPLQRAPSFFENVVQDPRLLSRFISTYIGDKQNMSLSKLRISMSTEKTFYINNTGTFFTSKNLLLNTRSDTFEVEGFNIDEAIKNQNKKLESIRDLEKKDTRVFIFGNPDLTEVSSETDGFSNIVKKYRNQDLENACVCLSRAFPTGQNIFVFIVRQELALQNLSFCHQYITVGKSITDCSDRDLNDIFVNIPTSWENLSGIVSGNNKRLEKNRAGEIAFDARNQRIEVDETKVTRRDRIFCLDGNSGNALWGPYVSIDPGSYEVRFDFSTASNYGECLLEILADVGQTHIKSAIYGGKGLGRCPVATLSFDTLAPLHDVEFRIAIKRVFKGEISRISLKKL